MNKALDKYSKRRGPVKPAVASNMRVIDGDCASAYTSEELDAFRTQVSVIGYGQERVGGWDGDEVPKSEKVSVPEEESSSESENTPQFESGETRFLEFQRRLEESERINEDKARNTYYFEDPVMSMRRKKEMKKQEGIFVAPPNRFGIQPGAWWDGVDRSNGFEKRRIERMNEVRGNS